MSIHPKEKPPPQPPPLGPPALWPHSGCVKMGSCLPPLVPFLNLCIFALIRKLWGENPKKAGGWGKWKQMAPTLPSLSPPPKSPPLTSPLLPPLPWPLLLVSIMVWWWGMTPMCPFSDLKKITWRQVSEKYFFQKMDLPLPWFCSSFWKVKIC